MSHSLRKAQSNGEISSTSTNSSGMMGCWKLRTWTEKMLLIFILVLFVGFTVAMTILVEIYLRLEIRLQSPNRLITDDTLHEAALYSLSSQNTTSKPPKTNPPDTPTPICLSPICIEAASRILTSIDPTADPCVDMGQFACGGWKDRQVMTPHSSPVAMVLENLQNRIDHQLRMLLEAPPHPMDLKAFRKPRKYFHSCMSEGQESARRLSVRKMMDELGGIVHPTSWINKSISWDLTDLLAKIVRINGAPLFDFTVQVDDRNSSRYNVAIGLPRQSGIMPQFYSSLPKELVTIAAPNNKHQKTGLRQKRQLVGIGDRSIDGAHDDWPNTNHEFGADHPFPYPQGEEFLNPDFGGSLTSEIFLKSIQRMSRDQKMMAAFRLMNDEGAFRSFNPEEYQLEEREIRKLVAAIDSLLPSDRDKKIKQQTNAILNYYTVKQLNQQFPFIDWHRLLRDIAGTSLSSDEEIVLHYPDVMKGLTDLFNQTTNKRIVHNSILMLVVRDLGLELFKPPPGVERWQFCVHAVKGGFGEILSGMYIRQFPPVELRDYERKSAEMFTMIKETIIETIQEADWLDEASRQIAQRKARSLRSNLISSKLFLNATFLEESVKEIEIDHLDFTSATWKLYKQFREDFFEIYSQPVDETTVVWQLLAYPMIANAFYLQHFNSMVLPLALLTDPMFSMDTPHYLSLGTLGFIMAHEIMHGFDRAGVEFDDEGKRNPWLSPVSKLRFQEKMDCIMSQYSNAFHMALPHNGSELILQVDGELTLNENIADLGAIKAILKTNKKLKKSAPALHLPGLNFTQEQVFFINAAQAYCSLLNPPTYALIIGIDEHTPPPDRVNGFLMNTPEFSRVFNCPIGSRLNPTTKCSIW